MALVNDGYKGKEVGGIHIPKLFYYSKVMFGVFSSHFYILLPFGSNSCCIWQKYFLSNLESYHKSISYFGYLLNFVKFW